MGSAITKKSFSLDGDQAFRDRQGSAWNRTVILSEPDEPLLVLTSAQKYLIRDTWRSDMASFYEISSGVYEYIFDKTPETKDLFTSLQHCTTDLAHSHEFRNLTLKFAQVIDNIVKNINNPDKVGLILEDVGGRHVQFVHRGFTPRMLDTFREALEHSMAKYVVRHNLKVGKELDETLDAWDILAQYIMQRMEKGFKHNIQKVIITDVN